jgi:hypothetical protein
MAWLTLTLVGPMLVTPTVCVLDVPTLALTESISGVNDSDGRGSATPAQPPTQVIARVTMKSTRTWYCRRKVISFFSPMNPKFNFSNELPAYPQVAWSAGCQAVAILKRGWKAAYWRKGQFRAGGVNSCGIAQ